MNTTKCLCACIVAALAVAGTATADVISFTTGEGYIAGDLVGQPGAGGWTRTTNNTSNIFKVSLSTMYGHSGYLGVNLSTEHGQSSVPTTVDYATKRMEPVTDDFTAGFSVLPSLYADDLTDETCIALGQSADSGWGPYLGVNKTGNRTLAYHDGTDWVEIATGIADVKWWDVEIVGDVSAQTFDVRVYKEEDREVSDPDSGLVAELSDLPFRDSPTSLAYVMISNEGSSQDTGAYLHNYDDLYLVPEPATLSLMALGGLALIRRRRTA